MGEVRNESSAHCPQAKIYIFSWEFSALENLLFSTLQPFFLNCPASAKHSLIHVEFAHLCVSVSFPPLSASICQNSTHLSRVSNPTVSRNLRGLTLSSSKPCLDHSGRHNPPTTYCPSRLQAPATQGPRIQYPPLYTTDHGALPRVGAE